MNLIQLSIKLFTSVSLNKNKNIKTLLPFIGTSLGVFVFIVTFTLMETIELDMQNKISKIIPKNKIMLNNLNDSDIKKINIFLSEQKIIFFNIQEGKFLINNLNGYNLINIMSINNLNDFINKKFHNNITNLNKNYNFIIGHQHYNNDKYIDFISCSSFNYLTGIPEKYQLNVDGLIDFSFLNFDDNYALISSNLAKEKKIFNNNNNIYIYIDSNLNKFQISSIININNEIKILNWENEYYNLFYSIKMEKYLYSIFGIMIIIISNFTFLITLSSLIINKIKQFGILEIIGFSKRKLISIILTYSLIQNIISLIIGTLLSYLFILLNSNYNFVGRFLNNNFLFDMNFKISLYNIFFIIIFCLFSMLIASIYPIKLLINLDAKNKLNYLE